MNLDRHVLWIGTAGLGYLLLALPLGRPPARKRIEPLFSLYYGLSATWVLSAILATWDQVGAPWSSVARTVLVYGLVVLAALLGIVTTRYVHPERRKPGPWLIAGSTILLGMAILEWTGGARVAGPHISTLGRSGFLALPGWLGLSAASYWMAWRAQRQTPRPTHRNRLRYWMLVVVALFLGDGLLMLRGFPWGELGTLLRWLGVALASVVLQSEHLPDLAGTVRQVLRYVLLTLGTAVVFWSAIWYAQYALGPRATGRAALIGTMGIALLLAVLYPALRGWLSWLLNRITMREGYDRERILREYNQEISNILDMEQLVTAVTGIISAALGVRGGALLVREEGPAHQLRPVSGTNSCAAGPITLGSDCPPILDMLEKRVPVSQYDLDRSPRFQGMQPQARAWFRALDAEIYVPILANDQLLGILALGAKTSGEPYSAVDVALLRTLAGQTAVALKNARLVEDLKRLNVEITQLNRDLTSTNERLAILDKTKSDFISIASHELKTPLTQIKGYTDMLLEMSEEESLDVAPLRRIGRGILRGSDRLRDVVEAMLDVSLIEQQSFAIHPLPVSLGRVIGRVVRSLGKAVEERHQTLNVVGVDLLPDVVADEDRLHQALRNVVVNSIKFTPDGGRVDIRGRLLDGGGVVELAVTDSGIGIDAADQQLIFEKFYRVGDLNLHSTGQFKFKGGGPGLGLPIARGIVEAHGGRMWVESRGHDEHSYPGSTFYITLPVNGPSPAIEPAAGPSV